MAILAENPAPDAGVIALSAARLKIDCGIWLLSCVERFELMKFCRMMWPGFEIPLIVHFPAMAPAAA